MEEISVFKWVCLLVAVVALAAFGWMLNDVRLRIDVLAEKADEQVPRILAQAERITSQLDHQLPRLLKQTEKAADTINRQLPRLLKQSEQAAQTVDGHLPQLLTTTQAAVDNIAGLSDSMDEYKDLMGVVHSASQHKDLFSYGSSILNFLDGQNATIGKKKPGAAKGLQHALPAKDWAKAARKRVPFLSIVSNSKAEMLHGLVRSHSPSPWYVQLGSKAPHLLADWLKDVHPESKEVK
jgi:hypothetical protein